MTPDELQRLRDSFLALSYSASNPSHPTAHSLMQAETGLSGETSLWFNPTPWPIVGGNRDVNYDTPGFRERAAELVQHWRGIDVNGKRSNSVSRGR